MTATAPGADAGTGEHTREITEADIQAALATAYDGWVRDPADPDAPPLSDNSEWTDAGDF
jgi:hypothetical protein